MKRIKKFTALLLVTAMAVTLCGCRFTPVKPAKDKVEAVAKQCINDAVEMESEKPRKTKVYAEAYYEYPFHDERGIEFTVFAATRNVGFVEPNPLLFADVIEYRTDYKAKIFDYYRDEIEQILSDADIIEYKISGLNGLIIKVPADADFADLKKRLIEIDELLDYSYKLDAVTYEKLSAKSFWNAFCSWDVLVRVDGGDQYSLIFSDGYKHELAEDLELMGDNTNGN